LELKKLLAIGYWREEYCFAGPDAWIAEPRELLSKLGAKTAHPEVIAYLRNGRVLETWRGWSFCRFDCGAEDQTMGHSDLTDGTWVWPEGLVHYVEAHKLGLPSEFEETALKRHGVVPITEHELKELKSCLEQGQSEDRAFWNQWSRRIADGRG
jgi:hypothetical protein